MNEEEVTILESDIEDAKYAFEEWRKMHTIENRTLREMFYWGYIVARREPGR